MTVDNVLLNMSKTLILEYVNKSRHSDSTELKNYIVNNISLLEAVSIAWEGEILSEANYLQTRKKVNQMKEIIAPYMNIPLYSFFNKNITQRITKGLNKHLLSKISTPILKGFLGQTASLFVSAPLASYGMSIATKLLSSLVYDKIVRSSDDCKLKCKNTTDNRSPVYHEMVLVCSNRCRIHNLTKMLGTLKTQKGLCSKSDKPLLCERNMLQQMIKIKEMKDKEMKILAKNIEKLNRVKSKRLHIKAGI